MNDITALPTVTPEMLASLKLSAMNLAEGEMMSFEPAVFRALVEALEKAQRYIDRLREWNANLAYESCEYQKRIASLESRTVTVKLPEVRITVAESRRKNLTWRELGAYNEGADVAAEKISKVLVAAGIQVIEGEGQ